MSKPLVTFIALQHNYDIPGHEHISNNLFILCFSKILMNNKLEFFKWSLTTNSFRRCLDIQLDISSLIP